MRTLTVIKYHGVISLTKLGVAKRNRIVSCCAIVIMRFQQDIAISQKLLKV